jgi:hypothetical protein
MECMANVIDPDQDGAVLRTEKAMLPIFHTSSLIENVPEMSRLLNRFSIKKWAGDFLV